MSKSKDAVTPAELSAALTQSGEGHHEKVEEAFELGLLCDPRFLPDVIAALENRNSCLADFVAEKVLPEIGRKALAPLVSGFDPKGGKAHVRRLAAICTIAPDDALPICRSALKIGKPDIKVVAISGLAESPDDRSLLLEMCKQRSKPVRHAALNAVSKFDGAEIEEMQRRLLGGKVLDDLTEVLRVSENFDLIKDGIAEGDALLDQIVAGHADAKSHGPRLTAILTGVAGRSESEVKQFVERVVLAHQSIVSHCGVGTVEDMFGIVIKADRRGLAPIAHEIHLIVRASSIWMMDAALLGTRRALDAVVFYDRFAPLVLKLVIPPRPFFKSMSDEVSRHRMNPERHPALDVDTRWIGICVQYSDVAFAIELTKPDDEHSLTFLSKMLDRCQSYNFTSGKLLSAMLWTGHPRVIECWKWALERDDFHGPDDSAKPHPAIAAAVSEFKATLSPEVAAYGANARAFNQSKPNDAD